MPYKSAGRMVGASSKYYLRYFHGSIKLPDCAVRAPILLKACLALLWVFFIDSHAIWADQGTPTRAALVIGNSSYDHLASLKSPGNDALLISETLQSIGFEKVTTIIDADLAELKKQLVEFQRESENADLVLVYFSGHGLEYRGNNYLLPVDAVVDDLSALEQTALNLEQVFGTVRRSSNIRIVILDACRSSPFLDEDAANEVRRTKLDNSNGTKGLVRVGLSPVDGVSDILVAFAAKAGTVAFDGVGPYSPFANALSKRIQNPGVDIRLLLGLVRDDVMRSTQMAQEPFVYGSVGGEDIYLSTGSPRTVPKYRSDAWIAPNGPYYGGADSISFVPGDDQKIWAARRGKVYRSVDGGFHWFAGTELGAAAYARSFAINPFQPERVFASAGAGLYMRELDGTWSAEEYFPLDGDSVMNDVAIAPDKPELLLVANSIPPRTTVGASSGSGATVKSDSVTMITDPSQEGRQLELVWSDSDLDGYVHRSLDGGATWTTSGMPYSLSVAISSGHQPTMFVGTADVGVLVSRDSGRTWHQFQCIYQKYRSNEISVSPVNVNRAVVGTSIGAYLLDLDAEDPCKPFRLMKDRNIEAVLMSINGEILVGDTHGLFVSADSGKTFILEDNALRGRRVFRLAESAGGRQLASLDIDGLAVREDAESRWEISFGGFDTLGGSAIVSDGSERIFVGGLGLWQTENSGSSFERIYRGAEIFAVEFIPAILADETPDRSWGRTGTLLIGTGAGRILRSIDGGGTWRLVMDASSDEPKPVRGIVVSIAHLGQGKVLSAAGGSLYSSDDLGRTWNKVGAVPDGELVSAVGAVDAEKHSALIGTLSGKVFECSQGCLEFRSVGDSDAVHGSVTWILRSSHDKSIWMSVENDSIFRLEEGEWTPSSQGLSEPIGYAMVEHPTIPGRLFVSTTDSVFASRDNGESWDRIIADGPQPSEIQALFIDPKSEVLFALDRTKILGLLVSE